MDDRDDALAETITEIAALFAEAYLRLRLQIQAEKGLASSETPSVHVTGRLTA